MGTAHGAASLVGRDAEVGELRRSLTTAAAGHGQVVVVEGEAGIGKTRIVEELREHAYDQGFDVVVGRCDDINSTRPFAALTEALGVTFASADPERRVIAELLADESALGAESALAISGKEFRVVELLGALVEKSAAERPLLLVIEDLHWADGSTLAALRSVARRIRLLPVLIVLTSRPGYDRQDLLRAIDVLIRDGAVRRAVGPLPPEDVASLAEALLGDAPSADLIERLEGATGNPLFVTEYIDALERAEADLEGVPVEFRLAVLRRVGQLSDATNDVLRVAAVLGSTFAAADLGVVLGETSVELASSLQQAMTSAVIGERGERLAFRHDLVRDAIYAHIPLDLRRQLHRQAGNALAKADVDPLVVAHHLALGAASHDAEAADWLRRAARDTRLRAPGVAVELLERARDLLPPLSPERDRLLADLVMPMAWAGRLADAEALSLELLDRKPPPAVAGPLRCGLAYALIWQGRPKDALPYTVVGEQDELSEADAVLLSAEAALAHLWAFDFPAAAAAAARAEEAARATGNDLALCHALSVKSWVAGFGGRLPEAIEICREAIAVADASGEGHLANPRFFPGMSLINQDRLDEAQAVLQRGRQISEQLGLVWSLPLYHSHLGASRFIAGDWDAAVAELDTALTIADEHGTNVLVVSAAAAWLTVIQVRRGEIDAAEETMRTEMQRLAGASLVGFGLVSWASAILAEAQGDTDAALGFLEPGFQAFYNAGANNPDPWTQMALVKLLVRVGSRERADAIVSLLEEREVPGGASIRALLMRCRGLVDNDADLLVRAAEVYRAGPRRVDIADTCADAALALIDAGRGAETEALLDEAMEIYEDIGAQRDIAQLRAELRSRGIARGSRRMHGRVSSGWDSLTETELKVVALVAQRMSNPEVAERLFVSRHTVESHLKNIYRKLEIGSRVELARAVAAHSPGNS